MITRGLVTAVAVAAVSLHALAAGPDNWPHFRGLSGGAIADDPSLPDAWSRTENVAWRVEVPGQGWGSPIVWGDSVFVTAAISSEGGGQPTTIKPGTFAGAADRGDTIDGKILNGVSPDFKTAFRWMLYAFDFKTGARRWAVQLRSGAPLEMKHITNTYASETPATDGRRVYVYHGSAGLFAVDFDGKLVWSREIALPGVAAAGGTSTSRDKSGKEWPPGYLADLGPGASPVVHGGRVYLTIDHDPGEWLLLALDAETGKEVWRVHRVKAAQAYGWSTPYIWQHALRTEIVTAGDRGLRSFDLDGRQLWEFKRLSINTTPTPFATNGMLYVASGFPSDQTRPLLAIRPGARGDISLKPGETSNDYVAWHQPRSAAYMNSSLVYGDFHYTLLTQGFLVCHDARTGQPVYSRQSIDPAATGFTASPWAYNGRIFALSEDGDTYVIQAGREFKVLRKNSFDEPAMATPAVVRGSLIIRTASHLYRITKGSRTPLAR